MSNQHDLDMEGDNADSGRETDFSISAETAAKSAVPLRRRRTRPGVLLIKGVLIPLIIIGALVAVGAHLGANGQDAWYTRSVLWIVSRF